MAIRTYKVTLDSKNTIAPEPVFLRQGDKTGAVVIDATLMDNGSQVSLSGLTPMFKANTADGQAVIADSTGFTVTDSANGKFTYQVPNALSAVPGKITTAYFSFSDSSGSESTFDVAFIIKKAVDISKPQADDYITIIDGTLNSIQKKIDAMNTDIQTVLEAYNRGDFYNKEEVDAKTLKSGVDFTDTSVSNSFESQPIDVSNATTDGSKVTGETVLSDGYAVTSGTVDGTSQKVKNSFGPSGLISTITGTDGELNFPMQQAAITKGELKLSYAYGGSGENKKYINSVFNAGGAAMYFKSVDPAATANFSSAHVDYVRQGALCAVAFKVVLTSDTGWVGLSAVPLGYTPASNYVAANLVSTSFRGQSCALYYNTHGWQLIPTSGQGAGTFQGVISYTTNDDYPYEDAKL